METLFCFTVLFSSPLCIFSFPSLTSIKSLHPQTDQREGWSFSLLISSVRFDADFKSTILSGLSDEDTDIPFLKNKTVNTSFP